MVLLRKPVAWILAVLLGSWQSVAPAHQMQVAMTTVTIKAASGTIEVIHRFYTHDTEQVLSQLAGKQVDLVGDGQIQQQFGRYVSENFQLTDQAAKPLPLSLVGVELEGDFIWVYQETTIPAQLSELTVRNTALLDILPKQVNTVNVECGDMISTLEFSGSIRTQSANIDFGEMGSCPIAKEVGDA
jgi:hypothetical protein